MRNRDCGGPTSLPWFRKGSFSGNLSCRFSSTNDLRAALSELSNAGDRSRWWGELSQPISPKPATSLVLLDWLILPLPSCQSPVSIAPLPAFSSSVPITFLPLCFLRGPFQFLGFLTCSQIQLVNSFHDCVNLPVTSALRRFSIPSCTSLAPFPIPLQLFSHTHQGRQQGNSGPAVWVQKNHQPV